MSKLGKEYIDHLKAMLDALCVEEMPAIEQAALVLADAIIHDHSIFAFGCTHSSLPIQDLVYRAGGLMLINPIYAPALTAMDARPPTLSTSLERISGFAEAILNNTPIRAGDVLIVVSVAGRNHLPIEMAQVAKERGLTVIAVTSRAYSDHVPSRHPSGKKMYEFADVVLDDKVAKGDAILVADGVPQKFCPTSGVINTALLQTLMAVTIEKLLERGFTPPVYRAANVEGGDEWNKKLIEQYKDHIFYF
jgi:uncharacterized phosphosugar-binding protein